MKKGTTIIASVLLVAAMAGPAAAADGHMSKGMDTNTNGSRVRSYQDTNYMDRTNTNSNMNMNMDGNYRNGNGDFQPTMFGQTQQQPTVTTAWIGAGLVCWDCLD